MPNAFDYILCLVIKRRPFLIANLIANVNKQKFHCTHQCNVFLLLNLILTIFD